MIISWKCAIHNFRRSISFSFLRRHFHYIHCRITDLEKRNAGTWWRKNVQISMLQNVIELIMSHIILCTSIISASLNLFPLYYSIGEKKIFFSQKRLSYQNNKCVPSVRRAQELVASEKTGNIFIHFDYVINTKSARDCTMLITLILCGGV